MQYIVQLQAAPAPPPDPSILTSGAFLGIVATIFIQKALEKFFPSTQEDKLVEILREQNSTLNQSLQNNTEALHSSQQTLAHLSEGVRQLTAAVMILNK